MPVNFFTVNLRGVALKNVAGETTTEQDITDPLEEFLDKVTIGEPKQHQLVHHRSATPGKKGRSLGLDKQRSPQYQSYPTRGRIPSKLKHGGLKWLIMM
jgi:hypothetical protein